MTPVGRASLIGDNVPPGVWVARGLWLPNCVSSFNVQYPARGETGNLETFKQLCGLQRIFPAGKTGRTSEDQRIDPSSGVLLLPQRTLAVLQEKLWGNPYSFHHWSHTTNLVLDKIVLFIRFLPSCGMPDEPADMYHTGWWGTRI